MWHPSIHTSYPSILHVASIHSYQLSIHTTCGIHPFIPAIPSILHVASIHSYQLFIYTHISYPLSLDRQTDTHLFLLFSSASGLLCLLENVSSDVSSLMVESLGKVRDRLLSLHDGAKRVNKHYSSFSSVITLRTSYNLMV